MKLLPIDSLVEIAGRLSGPGALNYTISCGLYPANGLGTKAADAIVRSVLGEKASINDVVPRSPDEMESTVRASFAYRGDHGEHPVLEYVDSSEFTSDLSSTLELVRDVAHEADYIWEFRFLNGHPFYPVFWDFAFVIVEGNDAQVLVGSVSD